MAIDSINNKTLHGSANCLPRSSDMPLTGYEAWKRTASKIADVKLLFKGVSAALSWLLLPPLSLAAVRSLSRSQSSIKDFRSLFVLPKFFSNISKLYKESGQLHQKISVGGASAWLDPKVCKKGLRVAALSGSSLSNATKIGVYLSKVQFFKIKSSCIETIGVFTSFLGVFSNSLKVVVTSMNLHESMVKKPHSELQEKHLEFKRKILSIKLASQITKIVSNSLTLAAFFLCVSFCPYLLIAVSTASFVCSMSSKLLKRSVTPPTFSKYSVSMY